MKYIKSSLYSFLFLFTVLTSCNKEQDNHLLDVAYPKPYKVLFADQTSDSIVFTTFDSYTIQSHADWIAFTGNPSETLPYDPTCLYVISRKLEFQPNLTAKTRAGVVGVNSYEYQTGAMYYQLGCLDIWHPSMKVESYLESKVPSVISFQLTDSANVTVDSLCFAVEDYWKLECKDGDMPDWISVDKMEGKGGANRVVLSLQLNKSLEDSRETSLLLSTNGVVNDIKVKQLKATREQLQKME